MPWKKSGLCVSCGRTSSSGWYNVPNRANAYINPVHVSKIPKHRVPGNKLCRVCYGNLRDDGPSIKRSNIPRAGNGVFANKYYKKNTIVGWYKGMHRL